MRNSVAPYTVGKGIRYLDESGEILVKRFPFTYSAPSAFSIPAITRAQRFR